MRPYLVLAGVSVLVGCAGQPAKPPPTAPTRYVTASGATVETTDSAANPNGSVDSKRLVEAKKSGFTVINKDGEQLYCRTQDVTGSHVRKETQCLTAQQLDDMQAQTQQGLQQYLRTNAPVQGH